MAGIQRHRRRRLRRTECKVLGQDRRVNMFTPENPTGIIILEMPKQLQELMRDAGIVEAPQPKTIEAEPRHQTG